MIVNINYNTTAIDVAFNLSGSLTGFPAVLDQLPVGRRVGFENLPELWEDTPDIGQTWTPELEGRSLDLELPFYNALAVEKAPFTTDLYGLRPVWEEGNVMLKRLLDEQVLVRKLRRRLAEQTTVSVNGSYVVVPSEDSIDVTLTLPLEIDGETVDSIPEGTVLFVAYGTDKISTGLSIGQYAIRIYLTKQASANGEVECWMHNFLEP